MKKVLLSFVPVVSLIVMLAVVIACFGSDALGGGAQVALLAASSLSVLIAMAFFHVSWAAMEEALGHAVGDIATALVILLLIGMLSGTWMASGVIPTMICYGMDIISPKVFLVTACLVSCVVSLMTGSSWTTVATIGVALMGVGRAEGFSDGWVAGAIISGAYFGDKMSPLSDTTVLASSLVGTPLFEHIRYMTLTTGPAITITLLVYLVAGLSGVSGTVPDADTFTAALASRYHISVWLLAIPLATAVMIFRRVPALIVLFLSAVMAAVTAVVVQPEVLAAIEGGPVTASTLFRGVLRCCYGPTEVDTGNAAVSALVATRGMQGMLNTIWLILCAMCFGACLKAGGLLERICSVVLPLTRSRAGLVGSTLGTGMFFNLAVCDQYLSIMLDSSMFKDVYRKAGYEPRLLSRSVEDSCTVTSVLIPWNTCGMTQSTVLGVSTLTYLPYCFFNILCPLVSLSVAAVGYRIRRVRPTDEEG